VHKEPPGLNKANQREPVMFHIGHPFPGSSASFSVFAYFRGVSRLWGRGKSNGLPSINPSNSWAL